VAMDVETLLDGGAYGSYGVASTFYTGALQTVTYHLPRYRFRGCRAFTNKPPCGPKRGHGTPRDVADHLVEPSDRERPARVPSRIPWRLERHGVLGL